MINSRLFVVFLFILMVLYGREASAQLSAIHDYQRIDSVRVIGESHDTLLYPFAGGLNSCQFMNMDINLDGVDDLLVFDRHGYRILPFVVLPASPGRFHYVPELAVCFPQLEQWVQAIDYNGDGRKDIFTYTTGGIKVYRNDSGITLKFKQVTSPFLLSLQGSTLTNILVTYADYPAIADIDADGDMDVLTFWGLGSFVEWHRNTSMERFGHADSLTFEKSSSCWGQFAEGNEDNTIKLDTCAALGIIKGTSGIGSEDPKHTGSTLLLNDLNGDGLQDITIGDVDFSSLAHLTNGGTPGEAKITSQTTDFPNSANPVAMNTFPAAMLADVNYDGLNDLLVSPFDPSLIKGENFESASLYMNNGTNATPDYNLVSKSFLQDQMLDFGSGAYPLFFDYNGDGLMDILVGDFGYSDTCIFSAAYGLQCTFTAKIALLLNIGTAFEPAFRLADRNIAHLDTLHMQSLIPALADMDGDGDADLVCGNSKRRLVYCENIASPGEPADFKLVDPAWQNLDVGDFAAPQLLDMDQDGLVDLVCGNRTGTIGYYRNTGSPALPKFTQVTGTLGGVDVTDTELSNYGYSVPCFYKGKQGETVLYAGSEYGDMFVYDQIDNNLNGNFRLLGDLPGLKSGWRSGLAIGDLNNDTLTDMLVGNYSGGLGLFYGKPDKVFGIPDAMPTRSEALLITPNPAINSVSVSVTGKDVMKAESLTIMALEGKTLRYFSHVDFPKLLDVSGIANGIYLVLAQTKKGLVTGKLMICR